MTDRAAAASHLFSPLALRGVALKNRVAISPMCQYSAEDGMAGDWHRIHLGQFALGGAGLVFAEAAAVEPRGRITHGDLGIWSADHAAALAQIAAFLKRHGAVPGIQIAHAGRKASMQRPWFGNGPLDAADRARGDEAWDIVAPSAEPVREGWLVPAELTTGEIAAIQVRFAEAAGHALSAGFEVLEIHCAHGYLAHTFLSPLSNRRTDGYGGTLNGRMRFAIETVEAVRAVWPDDLPLFVRLSTVDGEADGWTIEDTLTLAGELAARGVDVVDCSSGGIAGPATRGDQPIPLGFRVPLSARVRRDAGCATMTHGLIIHPGQADAIVRGGKADIVGIARTALYDPYWARHAAAALGADPEYADWPEQYGWWLARRAPALDRLGETQAPGPESGSGASSSRAAE